MSEEVAIAEMEKELAEGLVRLEELKAELSKNADGVMFLESLLTELENDINYEKAFVGVPVADRHPSNPSIFEAFNDEEEEA